MFKIAPVILGALAFSTPNIALAADSNAIIKAVTVSITTTGSIEEDFSALVAVKPTYTPSLVIKLFN